MIAAAEILAAAAADGPLLDGLPAILALGAPSVGGLSLYFYIDITRKKGRK